MSKRVASELDLPTDDKELLAVQPKSEAALATVATRAGVEVAQVEKFVEDHAVELAKVADRVRLRMGTLIEERAEQMTTALLDSACDSSNRNQSTAAKVLLEGSGVVSKQPLVHVGDLNQNLLSVQLEPGLSMKPDPEREAELRRKLGMI